MLRRQLRRLFGAPGLSLGEAWTAFLVLFLGRWPRLEGCCRRAAPRIGTAAGYTRPPGSLSEIADLTGLSPHLPTAQLDPASPRTKQETARLRRSDVEDI